MEKLDTADALLKKGEFTKAIKLYEEVHEAYPEEESVLLMLAWAHYDSGATEKAVACLEILLAREMQRKIFTGFAFDELVRIYKQERKFTKLIEICSNASAGYPDDVGLLIELGNAFQAAGRAGEACDIYKKLIRLENDNPAFHCLLGEALFSAGLTAESETQFLRAGGLDPDEVDHYYFKIAGLFSQNRCFEDAARLFKKCIAAKPDNPLYHCSLGDALVGLGKIVEAEKEYETAVHQDNSGSGAYYNRFGNTLAGNNYHFDAVKAFKKALEIEPYNPVYIRNLTVSCKALGLMHMVKNETKS